MPHELICIVGASSEALYLQGETFIKTWVQTCATSINCKWTAPAHCVLLPDGSGIKTSRRWDWRKMVKSCFASPQHMVSATFRTLCRNSRGESRLTTSWKLWPVHQVKWQMLPHRVATCHKWCASQIMCTQRLFSPFRSFCILIYSRFIL